ncbi:hypothetical protein EB796_011582 [Bugula neritina]|uniref:EGF-like domain-containing protein n=1 Tax=Bugula neritina TaxID=10212 RepID=A0A7J7JUQ9_BUGNE|nr:hypothetical protein EB796_011582 [Bugula neritina]
MAKCTDIDDREDESSCGHICINSPGSYVCACNSGYELNEDEPTCDVNYLKTLWDREGFHDSIIRNVYFDELIDINECEVMSPCHQLCENTLGSYKCNCTESFILSSDSINCEPADPCAESNNCDTDNGLCSKVNIAEVCSCVKGYTLNGDGKTCDETDECALGTDACSQICTNTDGGYDCSCESGYILDLDGNTCTGGYECVCAASFVEVNGVCIVLDFKSPVPEITGTVDKEAKVNFLRFSLKAIASTQYTVEKETILFDTLAKAATSECSYISCDFITSSQMKRKKRATVGLFTFYKEYFSRLPRFPKYDENNDLQLGIYVKVPDVGYLRNVNLQTILEDSLSTVESATGFKAISILNPSLTTLFESTTTVGLRPQSSTLEPANKASNKYLLLYIRVGVTINVLVIGVAIAVIVCLISKSKKNRSCTLEPPAP